MDIDTDWEAIAAQTVNEELTRAFGVVGGAIDFRIVQSNDVGPPLAQLELHSDDFKYGFRHQFAIKSPNS